MKSLPLVPARRASPSHGLPVPCVVALAACLAVVGAGAHAASASPQALAGTCNKVDLAPAVQVALGKSTIVRPAAPITRLVMGSPDNSGLARQGDAPAAGLLSAAPPPPSNGVAQVDVLLLSPSEIYVLGKGLGSTNVVMLDRKGGCTAFDVVVSQDIAPLQAMLAQLLPDEKDVKVTAAFDSIVLSGAVSDAEALTRVTDLANAYLGGVKAGGASNPRLVNMLGVGAPQQVMLEVKVAEVSKSLIDKFGVQVAGSKTNGSWTYGLLADFLSGGNAAVTAFKAATGNLIALDAQKDDGLVKVLAEPSIMAISGQTGSFLAGGKIFIPVAQTTDNGVRSVTLEEKEFGVSVKFTPTVLGGGRINLRVRPEVSELNREGITLASASGSGTSILPSMTSRKAETTVQLMDGQSFAIGGLIKNNTTTNIKAFPFLGELPVVGALFRSNQFQADRSELVFVVTPRLVKPLPADYRLPTDGYIEPSRAERLWKGKTESDDRPQGATAPAQPPAAPAASPAAAPPQGGFDTSTVPTIDARAVQPVKE